MDIRRYKAYLIGFLLKQTNGSLEEIKKEVDLFVDTEQGKLAFDEWCIQQINQKPKNPIKSVGKIAWDIYDEVNPISELKDFS